MRQLLALGTLGVGYLAARSGFGRARPALHPILAQHTDVVRWNAPLVYEVHELAALLDDDELHAIMYDLDQLRAHACAQTRAATWDVQADVTRISRRLAALVNARRPGMTTPQIQTQVRLVEDVVPEILAHLETIQHNHMLDTLV